MNDQAPPPPPPGQGGYPQGQPGGQYPPPQGQGYPPQQGQGYPPQGYYQEQPKKGKGLAIAALVLAILGFLGSWFVLGGILSLIAIVLGFVASGRAKRGQAGGRGIAISGIILGVIGLLIAAAIVAFVGAFWNSESFSSYRDCLNSAGNDQTAIDKCGTEFQDQVENQTN